MGIQDKWERWFSIAFCVAFFWYGKASYDRKWSVDSAVDHVFAVGQPEPGKHWTFDTENTADRFKRYLAVNLEGRKIQKYAKKGYTQNIASQAIIGVSYAISSAEPELSDVVRGVARIAEDSELHSPNEITGKELDQLESSHEAVTYFDNL